MSGQDGGHGWGNRFDRPIRKSALLRWGEDCGGGDVTGSGRYVSVT
ncbi:hypothetical protein RMSM_04351 [Rhodopirellula maiorica SM1]|uniref:Uncharacterized protein n=1 Tax=Rhodopirellula maiorica SM1 TaxID=1265738 RepID=M5RHA1_9BACT|nr:hypothetical protein RMSM_04351 [Rhodopirellula maiorica SM1]